MCLCQWHCLQCHLGWQCSPALPAMAPSTMAQPTMEYLMMAQPLFAPPKTAPLMHPLHQVHPSLILQPTLHHEVTLIKRGPFWVGNKKYRAGLSLCDFFPFPTFIIKKTAHTSVFCACPFQISPWRANPLKWKVFQFLSRHWFSILNPHETQNNGQVSSLTGLFLSTTFIVSKTCAFNLILVFLSSQWSVGGGKRHNTPFHNDLCLWGCDLILVVYGLWHGSLFSHIQFCSRKVWYHVSLFA